VNTDELPSIGAGGYLSTGPIVWAVTLALTTLLLALLKQALWLVIPFLLAIILYYALIPAVRRLTLAGVARETAASIVAGTFFVAAVVAIVPAVSWLATHAASSEQAFLRYLEAGRGLVYRTLGMLEAHFGFLERMGLQEALGRKLAEYGASGYVQERLTSLVLGLAAWLPSLLLAPFIAFFFLRDGQRFLKFLGQAVPNAFFERTLYLVERVDSTARAYFQGLLKLTAIDTVLMALGLAALGVSNAFALGLIAAVLAWVPVIGPVIGCTIIVLVTATDFPVNPWIVYAAFALFLFLRLLDDFVFMPMTVGRSLRLHPLPTVLLLFVGGAVAGVPGLILALPLAGVVMVIAGTVGGILNDPRLRARHAYARALRERRITADLKF
jgi:predicted PurR-regulated permease PerM